MQGQIQLSLEVKVLKHTTNNSPNILSTFRKARTARRVRQTGRAEDVRDGATLTRGGDRLWEHLRIP